MTTGSALLVFPHQLFAHHPGLDDKPDIVAVIEDSLFFGDSQYPARFHKQKLWFHRATMTRYADMLQAQGHTVSYIEHDTESGALGSFLNQFSAQGGTTAIWSAPHDFALEKRLNQLCNRFQLEQRAVPTPMFLNSAEENHAYRSGRKRWFMADFYKFQRRRLDVLMDGDQPAGGKWSFDEENRKKVPKKRLTSIPTLPTPTLDTYDESARKHVASRYADNPGKLEALIYPTSHESAAAWLERFIHERFELFGDYEDALVEDESFLWHSVLTPMLNVGLLTPEQVLSAVLAAQQQQQTPLNSLEGFVRQVIGWREFMRATYEDLGVAMRTTNHWNHNRKLPSCFYDATTGIEPVDNVIRHILATGYCNHIERLMVLGGFMFLCEFHPDDIYRWFMEMFIDSYDWVMVPNVYAMSQNADGGLITTKPYFSGSAYIRKMSHYKKGEWADIWDGLYWRWILKNSDSLAKNPRWAMMCAMGRRMSEDKKATHLRNAEEFLSRL